MDGTYIAKIVKEYECGIIVKSDIQTSKKTIEALINNPPEFSKMGHNGYNVFIKKYNWDIMEKRLYDLYENIIFS
jgi:glycosyltransferase involved in cell wall biosynthesis